MLPNATKFLDSIPNGFHVRVKPVEGGDVDGVIVTPSDSPSAGEYGMTFRAPSTLYVVAPFRCPRSVIRISKDGGKTWEGRRVESVEDDIVFLSIGLGSEA